MKFWLVHFTLFSEYILDYGEIHVMYLEINVKCCQNFIKSKKIKLTFMYEYTINKCLPEWDTTTPLMKKVRFSCMESLAL